MGFFGGPTKKRSTPRAVLNKLNRRIAKRQRADAKRKDKAKTQAAIAAARKKLRGY